MSYKLLTENQTPLDSNWFDLLNDICDGLPEVYIKLGPNAERLEVLRNEFINSNYSNNPDLSPRDLDVQQYIEANIALTNLRNLIADKESNDVVVNSYVKRIDELIAHHNILIAAVSRNTESFRALNHLIYGKPNDEIFAASCNWIRQLAQNGLSSKSERTLNAAEGVLGVIPELGGKAELIIPNNATFESVRRLHLENNGYLDQLLAGTEIPEGVNQLAGEPILKQVLRNLDSNYSIRDADVFWGVSHASKSIYRPAQYELSKLQFTGIILHELGSHLLEYVNGSRQPLKLLATGLDRCDHINEGRAFLREQIVYENPGIALNEPSWEHIITLHLAISLSCGLYDHEYTFSEVYEVIYKVGLLMQSIRNPNVSVADSAHEQAWITTTRVLKGIPGETYMKDIVYLEGNVRCWQIAAEKPERILTGDLGKFDISRQDHLEILKSINIDVL